MANTVNLHSKCHEYSNPPITSINLPLVLFDSLVMAGFPSPATDHAQKRIDLNDHLLLHR